MQRSHGLSVTASCLVHFRSFGKDARVKTHGVHALKTVDLL